MIWSSLTRTGQHGVRMLYCRGTARSEWTGLSSSDTNQKKEQNAALGASESIPTILERTAWGSERKTNGGRQAREWKSKEINVKEDFPWKWIKVSQWNGRSKVMRLMDIINSTLFKINSFWKADIFGYLPRNRVQQGIYFIIKMLYKILLKQEYFSILFKFNILWTVIFF